MPVKPLILQQSPERKSTKGYAIAQNQMSLNINGWWERESVRFLRISAVDLPIPVAITTKDRAKITHLKCFLDE